MRGGYPVYVVFLTAIGTAGALTGERRQYWCVKAGMIGYCGHEHLTEESAAECLIPMTDKYRAARWPKKKKEA